MCKIAISSGLFSWMERMGFTLSLSTLSLQIWLPKNPSSLCCIWLSPPRHGVCFLSPWIWGNPVTCSDSGTWQKTPGSSALFLALWVTMWGVCHPQSSDVAGSAAVVPVLREAILDVPAQLSTLLNTVPQKWPRPKPLQWTASRRRWQETTAVRNQ